jgi:hypothetical protein
VPAAEQHLAARGSTAADSDALLLPLPWSLLLLLLLLLPHCRRTCSSGSSVALPPGWQCQQQI